VLGPDGPLDVVVEDASAEGLFVPTTQPIAAGAPVVVRLDGDEHPGLVTWAGRGPLESAPTPGFAVRFTPPLEQAPLGGRDSRRRDATPLVLVSEAEIEEAGYAIAAERFGVFAQPAVGRMVRLSSRRRTLGHWRAVQLGQRLLTAPSVEPELVDAVVEARLHGVMVLALLEELALLRDGARFGALAAALAEESPGAGGDSVVDGALALWRRMWRRLEELPRFAELAPVLRHDWREVVGAVRFARLTAELPELRTAAAQAASEEQRLLVMAGGTVDLMASLHVPRRDLGAQRRAAALCQRLTWIGAALTTWRAELEVSRAVSGVIAVALEERVLSADDVASAPLETLAWLVRASGIERRLLCEWEQRRAALAALEAGGAAERARRMQSLLVLQLAAAGRE
jgi:hypothetical protein